MASFEGVQELSVEGNERWRRASGRRKEKREEGKRGKEGGGKAVGFLRGEGWREGRVRRWWGEFRVAINAVELTPGWPFAGKVRLKEGRNGRQLPPQRAVAVREGVRLGGHDSNPLSLPLGMSITQPLENRSRFNACLIFRPARSYVSFCHIQSDPDIDDTIESFVHRSLEWVINGATVVTRIDFQSFSFLFFFFLLPFDSPIRVLGLEYKYGYIVLNK